MGTPPIAILHKYFRKAGETAREMLCGRPCRRTHRNVPIARQGTMAAECILPATRLSFKTFASSQQAYCSWVGMRPTHHRLGPVQGANFTNTFQRAPYIEPHGTSPLHSPARKKSVCRRRRSRSRQAFMQFNKHANGPEEPPLLSPMIGSNRPCLLPPGCGWKSALRSLA